MTGLLILIVIIVLLAGGWWGFPLIASAVGMSVGDSLKTAEDIVRVMRERGITPADVEAAYRVPAFADAPGTKRDIGKKLFSYLGAIFIFAGIGTYISMFWDTMGSAMRIFVTLGIGFALLGVLLLALKEQKYPKLILPLSFAAVFMQTSGWFVLIQELFPQGGDPRKAALFVAAVIGIQQAAILWRYPLNFIAFTALCAGYSFLQLGLDILGVPINWIALILGGSLFAVSTALAKSRFQILAPFALFFGIVWLNGGLFDLIKDASSIKWAMLLTGLSVTCAAYGCHTYKHYPRLVGIGYLVGSSMFYGGLFDLVRDQPYELAYLAATVSGLYFCTLLHSRALLFTSSMALLGFVGYFTEKYFVHSLGWPISLILMGVAFLGVSALAMQVKKKI